MYEAYQENSAVRLVLFLAFFALSAAALIAAWVKGRAWGDLSSRRHYGEALSDEEQKRLKLSRRSFFVWAGLSLLSAAISFFSLR